MPIFLDKTKNTIAQAVLVIVSLAIAGFLYWQMTSTIDAKNIAIKALEQQVVAKDARITELDGELTKAKASQTITKTVTDELKQEEKEAREKNSIALSEIKRQIEAIDLKYRDLPKSPVNDERKSSEIAVVRAKGLWATYCIQEPTSVYCKK